MSRDLGRTQKFGGMGLGLLAVLFLLVLPLRADIHPVPLDKNTDAAKCLECHASDDSREFGGSGPAGPHGSIYPHILERNYQFTQSAVPGGIVNNTYPTPDLSPQGPYALCAKCHDLNNIISNASWPQHSRHISNDGFSCSVCHTAHGLGSLSAGVSGERLINFDIAVVGQNQTAPITYNRSTNTCTLMCHNAAHNPNGTVSVNGVLLP
jgi:hypothetical protein